MHDVITGVHTHTHTHTPIASVAALFKASVAALFKASVAAMFKASVAAMLHAPLDCITCLSVAHTCFFFGAIS